MKIKERLTKWYASFRVKAGIIGQYLLARSQEMSGKRGLIQVMGGVSWASLDTSSKGELIMAATMIVLGLIQMLTSDEKLYGKKP